MPTIDQIRLRRFRDEANAAHSALKGASEECRRVHRDLTAARNALENALHPLSGSKTKISETEGQTLKKAVSQAEAAFRRAEAERDRLADISTHAGRIWTRCKTFAAAHGALPADLQD